MSFSSVRCLFLSAFLAVMSLWGVSAFSMTYPPEGLDVSYTQPDGDVLSLKVFGTQECAETRTLDGYTVVFDPDTQTYFYAVKMKNGSLAAGKIPAQNTAPPDLMTPKGLSASAEVKAETGRANYLKHTADAAWAKRWRQGKEEAAAWRKEMKLKGADVSAINYYPPSHTTTGSYKGLCIIVQFQDESGAFTQTQVDNYCNLTGYSEFGNYGSVKDYYYAQSNNLLTYTNLVTSYVTLPHPKSYYNDTSKDCGLCGRLLVTDSVNALVAAGFDFSSLSADGSGLIYATNVLFAGANSGVWMYGLWPHRWTLASPLSVGGGKYVYDYQITNMGTTSLAIGTFCHENGHMLCGYSDYYDYTDASAGVGAHCLMASGDHLNSGKTPGPIDAYLKWKSGWVTPTTLTIGQSGTYTVSSSNTQCYALMRSSTEYFLIENRQKTGWASYLPAAGLAIWHVDETKDGDNEPQMTPALHYELSLEQANGLYQLERDRYYNGSSTDYFYSPTYTTITDSTTPNVKWWSGAASGINIGSISAIGSTMSFSVIGAAKMITVVSPAASTNVSRGVDFQITWTSQNITGNVKIELYKASSLLSVISSSASNSGSFTWAVPPSLAAASDYTVKITSLSDTSVSGTSGVFSIVTSSRQYSETVLSSSAFIGGGTARGWSGDDKSWLYTLPFSFPYYGSSYSAVYVNSNGYLDFASPVPDWEPDISKLIVSKRICPFWSDLTVSEIYIHQPSSDSVCIRWAGTVCATGSALNIEAVLHKNGKVRFNYGAGNLAASPPVTGMSAGDGKSYDLSCYYGLTAFGNINSEEFTPLNGAPQTAVIKLEPQPAPGGAGNPSAYTTVITGAQTDISASAGVGYRFYAWTCDEGAVFSSQTPGSKVSVSNNRKIFANFISSAAGTLGAWGDNASGQLTMNSVTAKKTYPVYIADQAGTPVSGLSAVSAGYYHTLALSSSGTVLAWGNNSSGQLGDGTAVTRRSPVTTLRADGSVFSGVIKISGGAYHSLAITSDGIVWAWGGNSKGQLGDGTTTDRKNPVQALKSGGSAITGAVDVSAGYDHSLALLADGTVYAWGGNSKGQLGNGSQTDQPGAVQVKNSNGTPFTNAAKICAGECSSFAVSSGAYLYSWGDNSSGQLGAGSQTPYRLYPATVKKSDGVTDFSNIAGVSIKRKTAAALTGSSDYGVYVWGDNSSGQVFGGYAALVYYPVRLFGGSEYSAVAAGGSHVLALRNEGRISAWGGNSLGQLGDSTSVTPVSPVATAYASDKPLVSASLITAGADFSCALFASPPVTPHLSGDFNGDGKSDLLFAGVSSQSDLLSFMSGVSPSVSVALPLASASSAAVAVGDFNGDGFADVIIRDSSAGTVQVWLLKNGAVISSGTVFGGDPSWKIIAAADFDGDGRDDILWQHETTAQTVIYLMDGTTIRQWGIIYDGADKNFKAALAGDLNGDGKADILWRNSSTGNVHGWLMSGFNILSQGVIYNGGDKAWLPVAMGDLNGDGKADIIWRHDNSGQVVCYFMSGLQLLSSAVLYNGADKNWRVAFCGDFNGDGYYDLAWRNISSGSAGIWLMKGSTVLETAEIASGSQGWTLGGDKDAGAAVLSFSITGDGSGSASIPPGPNNIYSNMYYSLSATPASGSRFGGWTLGGDAYISRTADLTARIILYGSSASLSASFLRNAALGDFNADRKADLLWSHVSTGAGSLWLMDGFSKLASGTVYDGGDSGWRIVGKGDLNGDGKCDIVWRHNTTALVVGYLMDGTTLLGWGIIYGGGDANWKVCAVGDVNGDGKADIIWRNSSTGQVIVYLMNGVTMTSYRVIFDSDKNWVPVGSADFDGDSMSDILWRNTSTNAVVIWLMNGFDIKNMGFIYDGSDKAWGPEATGDINGDGKADIIWRNSSTGWTLGYLMDGLTLKQYGNIVQTDSLNWKVSDSGDYNGDGKADMCLRHDATGEVRMLLLNGLSVISSQTVRSGGDANIILIGNVTDSSK